MANKKGAGGNMTGTSVRVDFERGKPGAPLEARSSNRPGETDTKGLGSLSLVVAKLPHRS